MRLRPTVVGAGGGRRLVAVVPIRRVLGGAVGRDLIAVLGATGRVQLAYGALLTLGLALG